MPLASSVTSSVRSERVVRHRLRRGFHRSRRAALAVVVLAVACRGDGGTRPQSTAPDFGSLGGTPEVTSGAAAGATPELLTVRVVARFPHDPEAFTQGLLWRDGKLWESTGLYGRSSVRRVD